jgi:hypothetical protein
MTGRTGTNSLVEDITGQAPMSVEGFVQKNRAAFERLVADDSFAGRTGR